MNIGIIGSAGRGNDGTLFTAEIYLAMKSRAYELIKEYEPNWSNTYLISGGAPYADHVAVSLFLESSVCDLSLYLPAYLEDNNFKLDEGRSASNDPGVVLNKLHEAFSLTVSKDKYWSRKQIEAACIWLNPCKCEVYPGFFNRNRQVAKASTDLLIAFTWSDTDRPPINGGTAYTWDRCNATTKLHIPLRSLK